MHQHKSQQTERAMARRASFACMVSILLLCVATVCYRPVLAESSTRDVTPLDAESMQSRVLILNTVTLDQTGPRYNAQKLDGVLSWYPRDGWLQEVLSISSNPLSTASDGIMQFSWDSPQREETIQVNAVVRTRNAIVPVRDRVPFPLRQISDDAAAYLDDGDITDQSPEIRALAQELASGKDDAYEVVFSLADWTTKNINYSLASLGQPAIQRSSQVFMSRYGKCDEMTSLFISLNRALGIPARFVAGYAYTDSERFRTGWGGHGWAEVWLPGQGWVPFDVTYGEYGYLDASHIALKVAPDAKENSIEYTARGNDFALRTQPLDITITPTELIPRKSDTISITLDAPHTTVDFGSAVLILANVRNTKDYYVSTRLDLAKTTSTEQLSANYHNVLLRPHETKTIPFLVRIDSDLREGYYYEFPFRVYTRLGPSVSIGITARSGAPYFDTTAFDGTIAQYSAPVHETPRFGVTCDRGAAAYIDEPVTHTCTVHLSTEGRLPTAKITAPATGMIEICDGRNSSACESTSVHDGTFELQTIDAREGISTRTYRARMQAVDSLPATFFVTSETVAHTTISAFLEHPSSVSLNDLITITLHVNASGATPKETTAEIDVRHVRGTQELGTIEHPSKVLFTIPARSLRPGENRINATITYADELGTEGSTQIISTILLEDVGILDRAYFMLEDAGYWVAQLFAG